MGKLNLKLKSYLQFTLTFILILVLTALATEALAENFKIKQELKQKGSWVVSDLKALNSKETIFVSGAFFTASGLSLLIDKPVRDFALTLKSPSMVLDITSGFGSGVILTFSGFGLWFLGFSLDQKQLKDAGFTAFESFLFAGAISEILKTFFGRERPNGGVYSFHFFGGFSSDRRSFPSGHTTSSFAFFSSLAEYCGLEKFLCKLIFALPISCAISRVLKDSHFFSDVVGGAILGTAVGLGFAKLHKGYK